MSQKAIDLMVLVTIGMFVGLQLFCWATRDLPLASRTLASLRRLAGSRELTILRNAMLLAVLLGAAIGISESVDLRKEATFALMGVETYAICRMLDERSWITRR